MGKITYIEDIIKEISTEFAIDERQVRELCKLSIKYIHKSIKDPKVISIRLPKLGILHFNKKNASGSGMKSRAYVNQREIIRSQIKLVEDKAKDVKDMVHNRYSFMFRFRNYFFKGEERYTAGKGKVYEKLQEKQNKQQ